MVIFLLKVLPLPSKRRELLEIMRNVAGPVSVQPGCYACEIYECAGDSQSVLYLEEWSSMENLQHHIKSALYAKILAAMELSETRPEIRFFENPNVWGLELIESLRAGIKI